MKGDRERLAENVCLILRTMRRRLDPEMPVNTHLVAALKAWEECQQGPKDTRPPIAPSRAKPISPRGSK